MEVDKKPGLACEALVYRGVSVMKPLLNHATVASQHLIHHYECNYVHSTKAVSKHIVFMYSEEKYRVASISVSLFSFFFLWLYISYHLLEFIKTSLTDVLPRADAHIYKMYKVDDFHGSNVPFIFLSLYIGI